MAIGRVPVGTHPLPSAANAPRHGNRDRGPLGIGANPDHSVACTAPRRWVAPRRTLPPQSPATGSEAPQRRPAGAVASVPGEIGRFISIWRPVLGEVRAAAQRGDIPAAFAALGPGLAPGNPPPAGIDSREGRARLSLCAGLASARAYRQHFPAQTTVADIQQAASAAQAIERVPTPAAGPLADLRDDSAEAPLALHNGTARPNNGSGRAACTYRWYSLLSPPRPPRRCPSGPRAAPQSCTAGRDPPSRREPHRSCRAKASPPPSRGPPRRCRG